MGSSPAGEHGAADPSRDHRDPRLLPTSGLTPDEFEDFTERLLNAYRFVPEPARRIHWVERWGRKGESQDGIDFRGTWTDGQTAAWQCKRWKSLSKAQVHQIVDDCSYEADEYYLTYSEEASRDARDAMDEHSKWRILDKRGLTQMFDDLPLHKKRAVLDATWGVGFRKSFLDVPGEDAFVGLDVIREQRLRESNMLNDRAEFVGRVQERGALNEALDRSTEWPLVIFVTGPGGRGKSRLLVEGVEKAEAREVPVELLVLAPGHSLDSSALKELPQTPAIIVVDDAHREVSGLEALLHYALRVSGTQIVLSYRNQGPDSVAAIATKAGIQTEQTERIDLGPLSRPEARQLVESLADGLDLTYEFKARLIDQAVDTPHIPVIALNLARAGKLGSPIALAGDLRREVMYRYEDLLVEPIPGVDQNSVRRALAAMSALGAVDLQDGSLRAKIASVSGMRLRDLLPMVETLEGRGLLSRTGAEVRVVPDVLADQIVESVAIVAGIDSGFAAELWSQFGGEMDDSLLQSLAQLDWRLQQQGSGSVLNTVWDSVDVFFQAGVRSTVIKSLRNMQSLPFVQPDRTIAILEAINDRLEADGFAADIEPEPTGIERFFQRTPPTDDDVRAAMAPLYGSSAFTKPEYLKLALERLWSFSRSDARRPNQHEDHPLRVIEKLVNLGSMTSDDTAVRVVAWVATRVGASGPAEAVEALALLKPLLEKEGMRTRLVNRRTLRFEPYLVNPTWARRYRDLVRDLLEAIAVPGDEEVAAQAVSLLGDLLRQPHGLMGAEVSDEDIRAWTEDDLLTLAVLERVKGALQSPVVTLLVRHELSWSGAYGSSPEVKYRARQLIASIDQAADVLCVALMNDYFDLESLSDELGETFEQFLQRAADSSLPDEVSDPVEPMRLAREHAVEAAVEYLRQSGLKGAVAELAQRSSELFRVRPNHPVDLHELAVAALKDDPTCIPALIEELEVIESAALDNTLAYVLDLWLQSEEESALTWMLKFGDKRPSVRMAVGNVLGRQDWGSRADLFEQLAKRGIEDPDPNVRRTFLMASRHRLRERPTETIAEFAALGVENATLLEIIARAAQPDAREFGEQLSADDVPSVLGVVIQASWSDWVGREILGGIATSHPRAVLAGLCDAAKRRALSPEIPGLRDAFDTTDSAVEWIFENAAVESIETFRKVVALSLGPRLLRTQESRLIARIPSANVETVRGLVQGLGEMDIWPLRNPDLSRAISVRAREVLAEEEILEVISASCRLTGWTYTDGVSEEVAEVVAVSRGLGETEPDQQLREIYVGAGEHASNVAERLAAEEAEEDEF